MDTAKSGKEIKFYIVGGFVRDKLLGIESRDIDYCVVGAKPEDMEARGFKQVGADFPVFLDDKGEEYALARTERKTGVGYGGFSVETDNVSLEDDLSRRDLTINAMAISSNDEIIDPFGGKKDLENKTLRHINESFAEDPLRVLRVARFTAKLPEFSVSDETMDLMKSLVDNGEIHHLTPERVFVETVKALKEEKPSRYFETLLECGALDVLMPEVANLHGVEQNKEHHPEVDTFIHTMMSVDRASEISNNPVVIFGALVHDLGKAVTPDEMKKQGKHIGHEKAGVPIVDSMCRRLKFPVEYREVGMMASQLHLDIHRAMDSKPNTWGKKFDKINLSSKKVARIFDKVITVSQADAQGRKGMKDKPYPQAQYTRDIADAYLSISMKDTAKKRDIDLSNGIDKEDVLKMKAFLSEDRKHKIREVKNDYEKKSKSIDLSM